MAAIIRCSDDYITKLEKVFLRKNIVADPIFLFLQYFSEYSIKSLKRNIVHILCIRVSDEHIY